MRLVPTTILVFASVALTAFAATTTTSTPIVIPSKRELQTTTTDDNTSLSCHPDVEDLQEFSDPYNVFRSYNPQIQVLYVSIPSQVMREKKIKKQSKAEGAAANAKEGAQNVANVSSTTSSSSGRALEDSNFDYEDYKNFYNPYFSGKNQEQDEDDMFYALMKPNLQ